MLINKLNFKEPKAYIPKKSDPLKDFADLFPKNNTNVQKESPEGSEENSEGLKGRFFNQGSANQFGGGPILFGGNQGGLGK